MGMITNLDGASTDRALKSIHAELERRQRYFRQFGVNNINAYTKLYKEGKEHPTDDSYPHEPLPHLFLISDEFAELKANEPDFMDELVSTARIGRSLGVHLILATQKPNGIVSEQIWSNSRFKIALKVSDPADSKEIIHTPDAASITQVGRAYLQVGNNEIYELFQSAYSSAEYNPTDNQHAQRDQRLWLINQLGQAELLTRDLSEIDEPKESEIQTQLEAVVDEIAKDAKQAQVKMPMKPWLPPLATHIVSPMIDWSQEWQANRNLVVPFAKLDIPSQQKQAELKFDLTKMNSTVIIGSAGYGKSMALQTIVTNLARLNNPEQVQFYLLDFGTNGLLPLTKLPHVGDIAGFDNLEKLHKLLKQLMAMLEQRKTLFQEKGVSNLSQYEALVGEHLPVVMIAVDAYDTVVENDKQREIIDNVLTQLFREGQAVGMYTILTANRYSSFRVGITSNLTTRIGLYMVDENAPRDMLGRSALKQSPIPGRGQLEVDGEMLAIQVYSPTQAVESLATVKAIDDLGETMTEAWHGKLPGRVPMLPVVVDEEFFMAQSSVVKMLQNGSLPVALSNETTEAIGFIPDQMHYYVLMTETPIQEATTEKIIIKDLQMLQQQYDDVVANLIDFDGSLLQYDSDRMQVVGEEEITNFMNALQKEINERRLSGNTEKWFIYIPKFEYFSTKVTMDQATIETMLRQCWQVGIYLIFQTNQLEFSRSLNNFAKALKKNLSAGSLGSRIVEQQLVKANYQPNESILPEDGINMFVGRKISLARLITRWSDE
ncbi:hypothetical protein FC21_GL000433 [Limosilactobacillus equigenerosi DSM 18793 = JCM 14505]|uniref:FtsK domain-containing protein n=4 Tax=Limosilactobacillus TaxID=2742598 RepID=A0A0R1UML6_9LACO|nr:hypothetical protein FC21_GL000433 [Limosilactobacillus equigenerosi DSM 18793 = JCM 14505]